MEIRLLGPLDALGDDGTPLPLGGPRQRALLAALALAPGRTVATTRLIDDLWGEEVPASAAKMVQIHVSRLRKALPPGIIATRGPGYALEVPPEATDLGRAEALVARGRSALAAGEHAAAADALNAALALWRGPALAEFAEPFAAGEARRLEELRLSALEDRVEADLALGRHAEVVAEVAALAARHPLRERLRAHQMLALYRSGRQGEALEAYRQARAALGEELGIEPSEALRDLERRMLRQDPALDLRRPAAATARREGAGALGRAVPVVGRAAEAAVLEERCARAAAGERGLVVVSGEAGAGKTTLVEAFLAGPALDGALVGRGQCVEQHGASEPYMPVLEVLEDLCRGPGGEGALDLLAARAPTWLVQLPWLVGADDLGALRDRVVGATPHRMLREALEALRELAADRTVVLVVEDLHWADPSSLDLLVALARRREAARLLVVATLRSGDAATRDHPSHAAVAELAPRGLAVEVALPALGGDDVAEYLAARLPGAALPAGVAAGLRERTAGNPLFLEKAVDAWIEQGTVVAEGDRWRVVADAAELGRAVPSSVRQLIRLRLHSIPAGDRALLDAGAVAAPEFAAALVADACGVPAGEAEERCRALAADGVLLVARGVEAWPDGTISERFGFSHDLCHEVLYDDLPAGRRAHLHAAVGERLERAHGDRPGEVAGVLAAHFARAGDGPRAGRHLATAAGQALARLAPREAAELARSGLELLEAAPEGRGRSEAELHLRAVMGQASIATRGWMCDDAERAFVRACELAEGLGLPDEAAWATFRLATLYEVRGEYARSEALMQDTLARDRPPDAPALADSYELLACSLFHQGDFEGSLRSAEAGIAAAADAPPNHFTAQYGDMSLTACHGWAAFDLWFLGHSGAAGGRAAEAVALARSDGHREGLAQALANSAILHACREEPEEALRLAEEAVEAAESEGFVYRIATGRVLRGWARAALGEHEAGIADLSEGLATSRATGAMMDDAYFVALRADALARAGRDAEALAEADGAAAALPRGGRFFWEAEVHRLRARLLARAGEREDAERALGEAVAAARRHGGPVLLLRAALDLARLLDEAGRGDEGLAALRAAYDDAGAAAEGAPEGRAAAAVLAGAPAGA